MNLYTKSVQCESTRAHMYMLAAFSAPRAYLALLPPGGWLIVGAV